MCHDTSGVCCMADSRPPRHGHLGTQGAGQELPGGAGLQEAWVRPAWQCHHAPAGSLPPMQTAWILLMCLAASSMQVSVCSPATLQTQTSGLVTAQVGRLGLDLGCAVPPWERQGLQPVLVNHPECTHVACLTSDAAVVCLLCSIEPIIMSAGEVSCSASPEMPKSDIHCTHAELGAVGCLSLF